MKLRTIIIDDEPIALDKLRSYVEKTQFLQLQGAYSNSVDALEAIASDSNIDVIFTDINMPDINGMEMVGALSNQPLIVFITAHPDYAAESYRHSAVDYLLKPYSFADFQRAANKVLSRYAFSNATQSFTLQDVPATNASDSIFIKVDYRYVRIELTDIRYIKGYGEYLQVYITAIRRHYLR